MQAPNDPIPKKTFDWRRNLAAGLLLLFFCSEAFSKIRIFSGLDKSMIPFYIKGIAGASIAAYLLLKKPKSLIGLFILGTVFLIGQWALDMGINWRAIVSFSKYAFLILILLFFRDFHYTQDRKRLFVVFEAIILINSLLAIIGTVFAIGIFKNYTGSRFGYNGLLIASSTAAYYLMVGLCYFLVRYREKNLQKWIFWILVIACGVQGTKSICLVLAIMLLFYLFRFIRSKRIKFSLIGAVVLAVFGFAYYLFFINPVFEHLRLSEGWMTAVFSFRNEQFMQVTLPFINEHWSDLNYLFGGVAILSTRAQMAIIDLPFFWGALGTLIFAYFFLKSVITFDWRRPIPLFCLLLFLYIAVLSGNFFYNASVAIYLLILRESFLYAQKRTASP